jgi:cell division initiation protein
MSDAEGGQHVRRAAPRLTPERVRTMDFPRTPIGRRGWSEDDVRSFLQRVAEEIAGRDAVESALRAEVAYYKDRLVQWQSERAAAAAGAGGAGTGSGGAAQPEPAVPEPTLEAINLLSQAQQEADAYVAQAQDYCRRLTAEARDHAQAILGDAQARAEAAAERAVHDYRARSGEGYAAELEELERRLAWARTFLASLETVETQLRTAREALTYEVDKLGPPRAALAGGPRPAIPPPGRGPEGG